MNKYTAIELFAGAGGLALGLEQSGFEVKGLVEYDKWAVETLQHNRKQWPVIKEDVRIISKDGIRKYLQNIGDVDIIAGGYPCQSFSYIGNKKGFYDTRGTLFNDFATILRDIKPKMFLAENVKGLVSHYKGKTLATMIDVFEKSGYKVRYKVLNAIDYGVAQKRERVIIIGIRNDIAQYEYKYPEPYDYTLNLIDVIKDVPESLRLEYTDKRKNILKLVKPGGCWRDLTTDIAKEYLGKSWNSSGGKTGIARRLSWYEPSLTILCSPMQKQTDRCHPEEIRPLTIRESARIQSFPDHWEFKGPIREQYKQIGNAVPVNMAREIGNSMRDYLNLIKGD